MRRGEPTTGGVGRGAIRVLLACLLLGAAAGRPASAVEREDFSLFATVASDYVFRGVSQSREEPVLQAGLSFEDASGWFAGLWTSTVDFAPSGTHEQPRDVEIDLWVGHGVELSPRWALAFEVRRYEYLHDAPGDEYDYTELGVALKLDRSSLALGYSDKALGRDSPGLVLEATHRHDLPWRLDLLAGLGYYQLESRFLEDYLFWNLTVGRALGRWRFELGYFDTDGHAEAVFGELAGSRLVASVSVRIL